MKPAWVRAVRDQCEDLGIAFFMKQIGSNHDRWPMNIRGKGDDMDDWPPDLQVRQFPSGKRAYYCNYQIWWVLCSMVHQKKSSTQYAVEASSACAGAPSEDKTNTTAQRAFTGVSPIRC
jgi:hypothetical protein